MANYGLYINGSCNGYDIEFWRKNWEGDTINPEKLAANGLVLNLADGDPQTSRISKTTVDITFHDNTFLAYYKDFFTADATKYKLLIKKGVDVVWSGYVTPDSFSYSTGETVVITSRDNLGYLEQLDFDLEGIHTIADIITEAQSRISWLANAWGWIGGYTAEGGTVLYQDSDIDCDYIVDKTWWEVVDSLLVGYQLRFVGNNTWNIYEVTELSKLATEERTFGYGSTSWEVIPSWKTVTVEQDYGVKDDLYDYVQKESLFTDTVDFPYAYVETKISKNSKWSNAYFLNPYFTTNTDDDNSEYFNSLFFPGPVYAKYGIETPYYGVRSYEMEIASVASFSLVMKIVVPNSFYRVAQISSIRPPYYEPYTIVSPQGFFYQSQSVQIGLDSKLKAKFAVRAMYEDGTSVYLSGSGWQEQANEIHFDSTTLEYSNESRSWNFTDDEFTINILSLPTGTVKLILDIYPFDETVFDYTNPIYKEDALKQMAFVCVKSISIEPQVSTDRHGLTLIGKINEAGNVKETVDVVYGETPKLMGGIGVLAYGLFKNYESLGLWQRVDGIGGVLNLSENIGRAYSHLSNAFFSGDERTGGLKISSNIDFSAPANIVENGNTYLLTGYSWDLTNNRASIDGRQVTPYTLGGIVWEANAITSGGGVGVSSGEKTVLTWDSENGQATDFEKRRVYELATDTNDGDGQYILLDSINNTSAKKFSFDTIRQWIAGKLSVLGGVISGDLTVQGLFNTPKVVTDEVNVGTARVYTNTQGQSVVKTDKLEAGELLLDTITYNKIQAIGGMFVISKAWAEVVRVEANVIYYKPSDGLQMWQVGDQPRMSNGGRFFWGLVSAVSSAVNADGEHSIAIDLTQTQGSIDSVVEGDTLVLYGSRGSDVTRQNVTIISSGDNDNPNPAYTQYFGIDSFDLSDIGSKTAAVVSKNSRFGTDGAILEIDTDNGEIVMSGNVRILPYDEKIDNLQFGTVNLLRGTSDEWLATSTPVSSTNVYLIVNHNLSDYGLEVGDNLTFFAQIQNGGGSGARAIIMYVNEAGSILSVLGGSLQTNGQTSVVTVVPVGAVKFRVAISTLEVNTPFEYKEAMLVKGNRTDVNWDRSPLDSQSVVYIYKKSEDAPSVPTTTVVADVADGWSVEPLSLTAADGLVMKIWVSSGTIQGNSGAVGGWSAPQDTGSALTPRMTVDGLIKAEAIDVVNLTAQKVRTVKYINDDPEQGVESETIIEGGKLTTVNAEMRNATVSGTLDGVDGSFTELTIKGKLEWGITSNDLGLVLNGIIQMLGDANSGVLTNNVFAKQGFSFASRPYVEVAGDVAYYYLAQESKLDKPLLRYTLPLLNGTNILRVPLFLPEPSEEYFDYPAESIFFNTVIFTGANPSYRYEIDGQQGHRIRECELFNFADASFTLVRRNANMTIQDRWYHKFISMNHYLDDGISDIGAGWLVIDAKLLT